MVFITAGMGGGTGSGAAPVIAEIGLQPRALAARGIRALMVGGVTTSMCVECTVRDAGQRDIRTFVVREATADFDPGRHAASLDAMAFGFARVIGLDAAVDAIEAGEATFEPG